MLTAKDREELTTLLREQRRALFKAVAGAERDLEFIAGDRESELEERAQEERAARLAARLDDRGKREIEEIDAALRRLRDRRYGGCVGCGQPIPLARLRALPTALHCVTCARELAAPSAGAEPEPEAPRAAARPLPGDLGLLSDRELEQALKEQIRLDGRIDAEELRVVCRKGVVHLAGAVPSERQRQELLKLLADVNGLTAIEDHVAVNELLWDRADRTPGPEKEPEALAEVSPFVRERYEVVPPATTEDIAESSEEDREYVAPVKPLADEE